MTKVISPKDAEELIKALGVSSQYNGQPLEIEALPNQMFGGCIHRVLENKTGEIHLVQLTIFSKDEGLVVCIYKNGEFIELSPKEYEILEVLAWNPETDELKPVPYKVKK